MQYSPEKNLLQGRPIQAQLFPNHDSHESNPFAVEAIINADQVRSELEDEGSIFRSTMDSETIVHLVREFARSMLPSC